MGGISIEISRISATDLSGVNLSSSYQAGPNSRAVFKVGGGAKGSGGMPLQEILNVIV